MSIKIVFSYAFDLQKDVEKLVQYPITSNFVNGAIFHKSMHDFCCFFAKKQAIVRKKWRHFEFKHPNDFS